LPPSIDFGDQLRQCHVPLAYDLLQPVPECILEASALVGMLSVAAAADLPRKEPPPVAAAPIGKYPIGKYPVGKYPVGKYPQPVVTKG
jgi:hypothetical protein